MPPLTGTGIQDSAVVAVIKEEEEELVLPCGSIASDSISSTSSSVAEDLGDTNNGLGLQKRRNNIIDKVPVDKANDTVHNSKSSNDQTVTARFVVECVLGAGILLPALPLVIWQIVWCTLWEWVDQKTVGLIQWAEWFNQVTAPYLTRFVQHPADAFVVNTTLWLGVALPFYFYLEFQHALSLLSADNEDMVLWWNSVDWKRLALYNLVRIGPMYMHFMYVYVLCHKEGHCFGKLYAAPYHHYGMQYIFNYYIGLFHGVLPGTFTLSHINNHHKYDNGPEDVYTTAGYPRDSLASFTRYIWIWFLYATNVSTTLQFFREGKYTMAGKTLACTCGYIAFVSYFGYHHFVFAVGYLLYPLVEANILLALVNYTWHAFIDPRDPDNDYVNSTTILEGLNFTLKEEYHVVHHQYSGIHWSRHEELYQKHLKEYQQSNCLATIFYKVNLFEIGGMLIFKQYDALAEHFVQLPQKNQKKLSKAQVAQLLKERLQYTPWTYE